MPIMIVWDPDSRENEMGSRGSYCPRIYCDHCGRTCDDLWTTAVVNRTHEAGGPREPLWAHKGACHNAVEQRVTDQEGQRPGWTEAMRFLQNLANNANPDSPERAYSLEKQPAGGAGLES